MSHYVTPFLVYNLGAEMVFVIAQRLQAQNVAPERAALVLEEIISVLISKQLISEVMKAQTAYSHDAVREIIEDVTQSSVMRLDPVSMGKLWDLITMVFKWQTAMSPDTIKTTLRHLYELETYITNPDIQSQLHKLQTIFENFNKILEPHEKLALHDNITFWLKDYSVRVSLLLRMGLQTMDGNFVVNNLNPVAEEMLRNLGENIYAVTQNGKILENLQNNNKVKVEEPPVNELQLFVDEMLGKERKLSSGGSSVEGNVLRLSICEDEVVKVDKKGQSCDNFDCIDVNVVGGALEELVGGMSLEESDTRSFRDDLLDIIGEDQ